MAQEDDLRALGKIMDFLLTSSLKKYVFHNWLINNILYLCAT